ncbi:acetyltransferase [Oceanobacillus iheyensis HTE831]|uniref:Acetyltransferase n=1 Tax=Oceanobacillus iheyensis (strain DSM 14371 / CIP 107618 / JCM 11309 / KCTC 3954 / HTE831) TaxID=221109 RepID=Q8EMF6_OCEIH|nr:acetyltransferase [Oceanobacillus iheyensis]BAC14847.1 acetyltransferase [Oceanobacillus iheyensis HTE831]
MSNKKLLIIGASGHGKVIADIAKKMNQWDEIAFLDDNQSINNCIGLKVIGISSDFVNYINDYQIVVGIGNNNVRENIYNQLEFLDATVATLIHPDAVIGFNVNIGKGSVVMAGTVINSCTKIGKGCIINTGATIDHDNCIGDFVHISPGVHLAGTVIIGKSSWLGIGSIVNNNVDITKECIIGANSFVKENIKESGTYVGVPTRRIST